MELLSFLVPIMIIVAVIVARYRSKDDKNSPTDVSQYVKANTRQDDIGSFHVLAPR